MSAEVIIEFERECYKCYGTSAWMTDKSCDACHNTGRVSTELGNKLLEFLEHHGFARKVSEAVSSSSPTSGES